MQTLKSGIWNYIPASPFICYVTSKNLLNFSDLQFLKYKIWQNDVIVRITFKMLKLQEALFYHHHINTMIVKFLTFQNLVLRNRKRTKYEAEILKHVIQSVKYWWNCTESNIGNIFASSDHAYLRTAKMGWSFRDDGFKV